MCETVCKGHISGENFQRPQMKNHVKGKTALPEKPTKVKSLPRTQVMALFVFS